MITAATAGLRHSPSCPFGNWRHYSDNLTVKCDEPGCTRAIAVKELEHNGPAVEYVYLPQPEGDGWVLGERDLCPDHATTYASDATEDGDHA